MYSVKTETGHIYDFTNDLSRARRRTPTPTPWFDVVRCDPVFPVQGQRLIIVRKQSEKGLPQDFISTAPLIGVIETIPCAECLMFTRDEHDPERKGACPINPVPRSGRSPGCANPTHVSQQLRLTAIG